MRMPRCNSLYTLAALAALAAPLAGAQVPALTFSGYGTLGAVHSDNDRADYLGDPFKPSGPGHTGDWSAEVDSRLGGQVTAVFTPRLSGVVQVLAQQRYDESWTPRVEWANLRYQLGDDLSVRAGRVVLPIFMLTDARRVGYAMPWVRPPVEMYSLVPVTSNDGFDASWRLPMGEASTTFQVTAGESDSPFPDSSGFDAGSAKARRLAAASATLERGPLSARAIYGEARLTIEALEPLADAFRAFGPPGEAIAARYSVRDRRVTFLGVGASYDPGGWFAMAEWARFDTRSIIGRKVAWYASGGMRMGKFTPYATYARLRTDVGPPEPGLPLAFLPPELVPIAAGLNAVLAQQLAVAPRQETATVGVRWDFWRSASLKVQYDRVDVASGSIGTFGNVQPGFERGSTVGVFSVAVDFVF